MTKIFLITFAIIILCTLTIFAQQIVLTISDFKVESDNPSYKYIGKGISRLVAGELRKSDKIILLEREEVKRILEEHEFSLSDLADESKQIQIGKFLSAEYIVFGEIIDMGNTLLLSLRMADVETGEIVWQEEITEKLETYDYIGAYFAKSIITELGEEIEETIEVEETTVAKIENKEEKKQEAIVKISEGIDAFDRDDFDTAKEVLEEAKELDPVNEVADYYLAKFVVNTTKFKIKTESYYSYQNPAFLGIMRTDRLHLNLSGTYNYALYFFYAPFGIEMWQHYVKTPYDTNLEEVESGLNFGYYFPLMDNMGFGIEAFYFWNSIVSKDDNGGDDLYTTMQGAGFLFSAGYKIDESISLGLSLSIYAEESFFGTGASPFLFFDRDFDVHPAFSASVGFLYRNRDESFIFDTRVGYGSGYIYSIDIENETSGGKTAMPLFLENTFTFALNNKNTFIIIKQINNLCFDRIYYSGSVLPAIEHYLVDWFSVRLGIEGSYALLNESHNFGYGIMGGITFRIISWGMDIDLNFSYRKRPSKAVEELLYNEAIIFINISWNDLFISR